jgi:hypothetical protein
MSQAGSDKIKASSDKEFLSGGLRVLAQNKSISIAFTASIS